MSCPEQHGWESFGGGCYTVVQAFSGRVTISQCVDLCSSVGGTLAAVPDQATNDFLARRLDSMRVSGAFVGLYKHGPEAWRWTLEGANATYERRVEGPPSLWGGAPNNVSEKRAVRPPCPPQLTRHLQTRSARRFTWAGL